MTVLIDQSTKLFGVLGNPVRHSLSPLMHNAAFRETGINAAYLAFESGNLEDAVKGIRGLNIAGMSVTIPFKSDIIPLLDRIDPLANDIGAVNTIVNRDNILTGYNTDASGALKALEDVTEIAGKKCLIIGAGGAARAIGFMLKDNNGEIMIANRSEDRGRKLCKALDSPFIEPSRLENVDADILINTTPAGMSPDTGNCPVPEHMLKREMTVMDIIYNPVKTKLLKAAHERGCITIDGLGMFIYQGAEQFRLWTGMNAPVDTMKKIVEEKLLQLR